MGWEFTPVSLNGVSLNDSTWRTFTSHRDASMALAKRTPVEVPIPGDYTFPESPRSQLQSHVIPLHIVTAAFNPSQATLTALQRMCDRYLDDVNYVVVDDDGTQWQTSVKVTELREVSQNYFICLLYANRSVFEAVNSASDLTNNVTSSPTTITLATAVAGTLRCYPIIGITPTTQKVTTADYRYRWPISLAWKSELPGTDSVGNGYPICITPDGLDTATETTTRMQADGDDLRVIVDGVEYPRTLVDMDTADTFVWTAITFAPMKTVTLAAASAADDPDDAESWAVASGQSLIGWPERGWFLVEDEAVWFGQRTDTEFQLIERGARATTAASHAAGTAAYWVEHDIQIISGYSNAANPTTLTTALTLGSSSNASHRYSAVFHGLTVGQTYGQMLPKYTEDNVLSPTISTTESSSGLAFYDKPAGGTYFPYNNAELYVPCGVDDASNAIDLTVSGSSAGVTGADIVLDFRVYGVDFESGVERLLATYNKAARTGAVNLTPDAVLQRLRFNAINVCVTGATSTTSNNDTDLNNDGLNGTQGWAQQFTLQQATKLVNAAFKIKENTSGDTKDVDFGLYYRDSGATDPDDGDEIWNTQIANSNFSTSYTWVPIWPSTTPYTMPAGDYDILMFGDTAGAGTIYASRALPIYAAGRAWEKNTTWASSADSDFHFLVVSDGATTQDDAPTGLQGAVFADSIDVVFDPNRTPDVVVGAQENIMVLRGTLAHETTGQTFTFNDVVWKIADTMAVDCKEKIVYLNASLNQFMPGAITFSDAEQWMHFLATGNTANNRLVFTDSTIAGGGAVNISALWYPVWG